MKVEFTAKVQKLGRIAIPKAERVRAGIGQGDLVKVRILEIGKVKYVKPTKSRRS